MPSIKSNFQKASWTLKTFGLQALLIKSFKSALKLESLTYLIDINYQYQKWRKKNKKMPRITTTKYKGKFSIIMPTWNPRASDLKEAIESVMAQTYENWEICISDDASNKAYVKTLLEGYKKEDKRIKLHFRKKRGQIARNTNEALKLAAGEFVFFMDNDDFIEPNTLMEFASVLEKNPSTDMIFTDEDIVESGKHMFPWFKPDFSPDTILSTMYPTHGAYRRSLVKKLGGMRVGYEGSQDYDLFLRFSEKTNKIVHIPKILYHWRVVPGSSTAGNISNKSYALISAKKALKDVIRRRKIDGEILGDLYPFRVKYNIRKKPTLAIISFGKDDKASSLNASAKKTKSDLILFLSESARPRGKKWLEPLVELVQRKDVGVVGGKIYFSSGLIKSAGIVIGLNGTAASAYYKIPKDSQHFFNLLNTIRNVSAIPVDCMLIKRETFRELNGFDDKHFKHCLFDVDFSLRALEKGYRNIYTPFCEVKLKNGERIPSRKEKSYFREKWKKYIDHDPSYNPNLSKRKRNYTMDI